MKKHKKKNSLYFSNYFPSPLLHTPFLSFFQTKNILKEVEKKKRRKHSLHSLFLSLSPTQTHIIFISLKKKNKKILEKEAKNKNREKVRRYWTFFKVRNFELLFFLFISIFVIFLKSLKILFPFFWCLFDRSRRMTPILDFRSFFF